MYSIYYNRENCEKYGIIPVRRPSVPAPEMRVTETEIPGRDGVLIETDHTYSPITISVEMNFLAPKSKWMETFRAAKRWLTGNGWLMLGDDKEYMYKVYYCRITDTERTSWRLGKFTAEFVCDPYSYAVIGQKEYDYTEILKNPYMISHPIYKITGSGVCTLTVNGNQMKATVNKKIMIDTDRMIAYNADGTNQSNLISGDYEELYLLEGNNTISITSGFQLTVKPNWRAL